jgi:glutamyl-tRNA synthetase
LTRDLPRGSVAGMSEVRTRFAPSPTGYLHLGGARTALFNYLFARKHGGTFVLRIEDTDRERSSQEFVDAILDGMGWLGLDPDEGPFFQSSRGELYAARVAELVEAGRAYHCFCSAEELGAKRKQAQAEGRKFLYDRTCRDLARTPKVGEPAVVRFKMPESGETVVRDLVRGEVRFDNAELDDLILVRSDGSPTFHLVVVVDDIDMDISHILRGEDHLTNTPRQMCIFEALGATPPAYGHLPLIVGQDRARLSKRHGATAVDAYREQGFLPSAVLNYLARLGWSHGDQEIFSQAELEVLFDVDGVGKSASAFDMEKFSWVNFEHMRALTNEQLAAAVLPYLRERGEPEQPLDYLATAVEQLKERAKSLIELTDSLHYFVSDELVYDAKAVKKFLDDDGRGRLAELARELADCPQWDAATIEGVFNGVVERLGLKLGQLAQPARVALTGGTVSPGIFELCAVLGRDRTLARLGTGAEGVSVPA